MINGLQASGFVQIVHMGFSGWSQMAQIRHFLAVLVECFQGKRTACLVRDREQMKNRVARAAQGHIARQRISDRFFMDDIFDRDLFFYHVHHSHSCFFCKLEPACLNGRDRSVARQSNAKRFA